MNFLLEGAWFYLDDIDCHDEDGFVEVLSCLKMILDQEHEFFVLNQFVWFAEVHKYLLNLSVIDPERKEEYYETMKDGFFMGCNPLDVDFTQNLNQIKARLDLISPLSDDLPLIEYAIPRKKTVREFYLGALNQLVCSSTPAVGPVLRGGHTKQDYKVLLDWFNLHKIADTPMTTMIKQYIEDIELLLEDDNINKYCRQIGKLIDSEAWHWEAVCPESDDKTVLSMRKLQDFIKPRFWIPKYGFFADAAQAIILKDYVDPLDEEALRDYIINN